MASTLKGGAELLAFLDTLPDKLGRNVLRGGMRAGAAVIAADVKSRASGLRTPEIKKGGHVVVPSEPVADKVKVGTSVRRGVVTGRVYLRGFAASVGFWAEYGTVGHFISVREEDRPVAKTRNGDKRWSVRTINRAVKRGSLVIGGNFIGSSVSHPGARAQPFMLPALDTRADEGMKAMATYINTRLTKEGLNAPYLEVEDDREA